MKSIRVMFNPLNEMFEVVEVRNMAIIRVLSKYETMGEAMQKLQALDMMVNY